MDWFIGNLDPFSASTSLKLSKSLHEFVAEATGQPASCSLVEDSFKQFHSNNPAESKNERVIETATVPTEVATGPEPGVAKRKKKRKNCQIDKDYLELVNTAGSGLDDVDMTMELDTAYAEVKKFAVSGMQGIEKCEAKERIAVELGAKPRKKKVDNYKTFKIAHKQAKLEEREARIEDRHIGIKKSKRQTKGVSKKNKVKKPSS